MLFIIHNTGMIGMPVKYEIKERKDFLFSVYVITTDISHTKGIPRSACLSICPFIDAT